MRRLALAVTITAVLVLAPAAGALTLHSGHGLQVVSVKQLNSRLTAVQVATDALPSPASIYILLPSGYRLHPHRRYPVLYLLDGTSGVASDWTAKGGAQQVIGNRQLITVMPDITLGGNGGGWCTDWPDGAQRWETFHIDQLIPWIGSNVRTVRARGERAIAGLSQGGFCSLSYAARHPDLFAVALGYSGAPDIYYNPDARAGAMAIINATEVGLDRTAPDTFFGDPATNGINWAAHDPATLAENLRFTQTYMYWGNGEPGPYDSPTAVLGASEIEGLIWGDNNDFQARLQSLGIPAYFDDYGAGTHSWPYWTRDLRWSIGKVMFDFAHPQPNPPRFTYASGDARYSVYGWQVRMHRIAREFSTLTVTGKRRFDLSGSGSATLLTPAAFRPGKRYFIELSGSRVSPRRVTVTAHRDRRLVLQIPLGPSNPYQQDTPQAEAAGTAVYTTGVTITRAREGHARGGHAWKGRP